MPSQQTHRLYSVKFNPILDLIMKCFSNYPSTTSSPSGHTERQVSSRGDKDLVKISMFVYASTLPGSQFGVASTSVPVKNFITHERSSFSLDVFQLKTLLLISSW